MSVPCFGLAFVSFIAIKFKSQHLINLTLYVLFHCFRYVFFLNISFKCKKGRKK